MGLSSFGCWARGLRPCAGDMCKLDRWMGLPIYICFCLFDPKKEKVGGFLILGLGEGGLFSDDSRVKHTY